MISTEFSLAKLKSQVVVNQSRSRRSHRRFSGGGALQLYYKTPFFAEHIRATAVDRSEDYQVNINVNRAWSRIFEKERHSRRSYLQVFHRIFFFLTFSRTSFLQNMWLHLFCSLSRCGCLIYFKFTNSYSTNFDCFIDWDQWHKMGHQYCKTVMPFPIYVST